MTKELGVNAKFGLDGTGFQEGISKINSELKVVQAQFKEAGTRVTAFGSTSDSLKEKSALLNRQIDLQKQAVEKLQLAFDKSVTAKGADAKATQTLEEKLYKAKSTLNGMEGELKKTTTEVDKQSFSWTGLTSKVKETSEKGQSHVLGLKNAVIGLAAAAAGGAGLFSVAEGAINAGDAAYQLSEKLHMSATDAGLLNKELTLADTNADAFTGTMLRLDKGVEGAGKKGNATTKALAEYGVTLTDSKGKLLSYNDQLKALADGYQKAAASGNEEAYTSQVLGSRGKDLVGILSNYNDVATQASKVKGIGIDPEQAHKVKMEMEALSMQVKQLSYTFGNALIPIVAQVLPPLQTGFTNLAQNIKDHQKDIKDFTQNLFDIGKTFGQMVLPELVGGFNFIKDHGEAAKVVIIGLAGAFVAFKTVTAIINGVTAVQETWTKATKLAEAAQAALNFVMDANPFGLVILVIAGLTAAFILLYNHYKPFHDFVDNSFKVISSGAKNMGQTVSNVINGLGNIFTSLPSQAAKWGSDFVQGLIDGIKNMIGGVTSAATNIANTIKSFLHFSTPDEGPLADYETWMPDFMTGLAKGIKGSKNVVSDALKGLSADMKVNATARISGAAGSSVTNNKKIEQHVHVQNMQLMSQGDTNKTLQQLQFLCPI